MFFLLLSTFVWTLGSVEVVNVSPNICRPHKKFSGWLANHLPSAHEHIKNFDVISSNKARMFEIGTLKTEVSAHPR